MLMAPLSFSLPPLPLHHSPELLRKSAKVLEAGRQKANQRLKEPYTKRGGHADPLRQTLQNTRLLSHQDSVNKTFNSCAALSVDGPALPGNTHADNKQTPADKSGSGGGGEAQEFKGRKK